MTERKLATIQKIVNIRDIEGSDKVQLANVLGWQVVVGKDQFHENDLVVFYEIDSFLPILPVYEFLRKNCYKKFEDGREGFRIKTIRLRKQISQGLVMPLDILPNYMRNDDDIAIPEYLKLSGKIGQDVTVELGVLKYEPPMPKCLMGEAKGRFPSFLVRTDETRVQLLQSVLDRHVGLECYATEKIDGSSVTYHIKDGEFGVSSRNLELKESGNAYWKWARDNDVENKLRSLGTNVAIQGEIYGQGINGNPLKRMGLEVRFYNVFNIDYCKYLDFTQATHLLRRLGFNTVPFMYEFLLINDMNKLIEMSSGKSLIEPTAEREGIVIRPMHEVMDLGMSVSTIGNTGRLSFKVVSPTYLLENDA